MPVVQRDQNELRWNSLFLLPKDENPNYYTMLFKNFKSLCLGMDRADLIEALDFINLKKIEEPLGTNINHALMVYKNLPTLNSYTKSRNTLYADQKIYKYTLQKWLDEIEQWIFKKAVELEDDIFFSLPSKQYV